MHRNWRSLFRFGLCMTLAVGVFAMPAVQAQNFPPNWPRPGQGQPGQGQGVPQGFPQGGQNPFDRDGADYFNLGPIGALGMPEGRGIKVYVVEPNSRAAKAGLAVGDLITGVDGKEFRGNDPLMEYADAFDKEEEKRRPQFELLLSGGKEITVELNKVRRANDSRPGDKSADALAAACEFLAAKQAANGSFPTSLGGQNGLVVVTSLAGLVLLGSGESKYRRHIDKAVEFVIETAGRDGGTGSAWPRQQGMSPEEMREWMERMRQGQGGGNNGGNAGGNSGGMPNAGGRGGSWDQTNWGLSYAAWFLASVHYKRANSAIKDKLKSIADTLIANQVKGEEHGAYAKGGGWAHGPARLGPNALDYLELEIVSNYALAALAFCKSAGVEIADEPLNKAIGYILDCTTPQGGTAYSTRNGQFPGTAEPGRTSGALFALTAAGHRGDIIGRMESYIRAHMARIPFGHGSPTMHLLAGAMASNAAGTSLFREYWRTYRLRIMLGRAEDGSIRTFPTEESKMLGNTDLSVGPIWTTANQALILCLQKGDLPLLNGEVEGGRSSRTPDDSGSRGNSSDNPDYSGFTRGR